MKLNSNLDAVGVAKVVNLPVPTASGDAATKGYVDGLKAGLDWKDSARAASTGNVNIASAPANIDGVALAANDRVLLKDQTTPSENGVYVFAAAATPLTRAADADTSAEVTPGLSLAIEEGTANADTVWMISTNGPINLGVTGLSFTQINTTVTAGTGLTKTGNVVALDTPVTVANGGTGGGSAATARSNLGAVGKYAQDIGDGAATSINVDHNLGTTDVIVQIFNKASGAWELADVTVITGNRVNIAFTTAPANASLRVVVLG